MPYIYRVSRREPEAVIRVKAAPLSYRDLQAKAKALGIPGNQTRDQLEAAIAEAKA
jgi:hypothetical protein